MASKNRERRNTRAKKYRQIYDDFIQRYSFTTDDLENEQWHDVCGYEKLYQVSNFGRIKSFRRRHLQILKPNINENGYLYVNLGRNNSKLVHRIVAEAFVPNPDNKPQVNHIDGNKLNNHVSNLEWATKIENERHSWQIGLRHTGEKHHNAKLTNADVNYICENPNDLTVKKLAVMFGVSESTISNLQTGKRRNTADCLIREYKTPPRVPNEVRKKIHRLYKKGVRGCGSSTLAKIFGYHSSTILKIIHEND